MSFAPKASASNNRQRSTTGVIAEALVPDVLPPGFSLPPQAPFRGPKPLDLPSCKVFKDRPCIEKFTAESGAIHVCDPAVPQAMERNGMTGIHHATDQGGMALSLVRQAKPSGSSAQVFTKS
jgi:hypothetical protein